MDRWTVLEIDAIFVSFGFFVSKVREPLSWRFKKWDLDSSGDIFCTSPEISTNHVAEVSVSCFQSHCNMYLDMQSFPTLCIG